MGENPLISDGKRHPSSLMEIGDKVLENFDASVKNSRLIAHHIFAVNFGDFHPLKRYIFGFEMSEIFIL
jgi:hypothetical protein